jgi:hypothetical protein
VDTHIFQLDTLPYDVGDLSKEHQLMEDTSICVPRAIDLHVEVDPTVCPRYMMQHESMGDDVSMQGHTMRSDSS